MPNAQQAAPDSELKQAVDRVARFESQLTERIDKDGQTILAKLIVNAERMQGKAGGGTGAGWESGCA